MRTAYTAMHRILKLGRILFAIVVACEFTGYASADTLTFGGTITQSTQDGTGPAVNNPGLNNVLDGDAYTASLDFTGSVHGPGTIDLTGSSLTFSDLSVSAIETSFASISLSVSPDAGFFDLSLLGCLNTGSSCAAGNQLNANFQIPMIDLNSEAPVAATGLDQPHPLDLLEDDGGTDIQGTIAVYSYRGSASAVPEPSFLFVLCVTAVVLLWLQRQRNRTRSL
jgi:hypothetical protein